MQMLDSHVTSTLAHKLIDTVRIGYERNGAEAQVTGRGRRRREGHGEGRLVGVVSDFNTTPTTVANQKLTKVTEVADYLSVLPGETTNIIARYVERMRAEEFSVDFEVKARGMGMAKWAWFAWAWFAWVYVA